MDESTFESKLKDLAREFGTIDPKQRQKLFILAQKSESCHKELRKKVNELEDSLDYLRVCIKYLLFDVEATRRENSYLRKIIEDK